MVTTKNVLIIVTEDLVSNVESIAALKARFSGCEVHQQLAQRLTEKAVTLTRHQFDIVCIAGSSNKLADLSPEAVDGIYAAMRDGAWLETTSSDSHLDALLLISGLVKEDDKWVKPAVNTAPVSLARPLARAGGKKLAKFKRAEPEPEPAAVLNLADLDVGGDEELLDEDDLVSDVRPAIRFPAKCDPGPGRKRRKACKDCTCGLKELEDDELNAQQAQQKNVVSLSADDVAEIDFTVPGKAVGGCGSCALGDAFRCDGCPYLGLPPFRPGEIVSIDQFGDDF